MSSSLLGMTQSLRSYARYQSEDQAAAVASTPLSRTHTSNVQLCYYYVFSTPATKAVRGALRVLLATCRAWLGSFRVACLLVLGHSRHQECDERSLL